MSAHDNPVSAVYGCTHTLCGCIHTVCGCTNSVCRCTNTVSVHPYCYLSSVLLNRLSDSVILVCPSPGPPSPREDPCCILYSFDLYHGHHFIESKQPDDCCGSRDLLPINIRSPFTLQTWYRCGTSCNTPATLSCAENAP